MSVLDCRADIHRKFDPIADALEAKLKKRAELHEQLLACQQAMNQVTENHTN